MYCRLRTLPSNCFPALVFAPHEGPKSNWAQSTVSRTTPMRLWGRSGSIRCVLLSGPRVPAAVKVLTSPQLSKCKSPGCLLKGSVCAPVMAEWAGVMTFGKKEHYTVNCCTYFYLRNVRIKKMLAALKYNFKNRLGMLQIPSTKEYRLLGIRKGTFSAVATALWDILPLEIRMVPTVLAFCKALKMWLVLGPGASNVLRALFIDFTVSWLTILATVCIYCLDAFAVLEL